MLSHSMCILPPMISSCIAPESLNGSEIATQFIEGLIMITILYDNIGHFSQREFMINAVAVQPNAQFFVIGTPVFKSLIQFIDARRHDE